MSPCSPSPCSPSPCSPSPDPQSQVQRIHSESFRRMWPCSYDEPPSRTLPVASPISCTQSSVLKLSITLLECCCSIPPSYLLLGIHAVLRKHSLVPLQFFATYLIHGYRYSPPRYIVHLSNRYRYPP